MSENKILSFAKKDKEVKVIKEVNTNKVLFDQLDIKTDELYIPYKDYLKIEPYLVFYPALKYIKTHITFIPLRGIVF